MYFFLTGIEDQVRVATPPSDFLVNALQQTLDDESFKINSPVTALARKSAEVLLEWCLKNRNDDKLMQFF